MASRRRNRRLRLVGITDDELIELAGPGAYEHGHDYYRQGFVGDIEIRGNRIVATVSGTHLYRVELLHDGAGLDGSCDCPASDDIVFCKHCVATALELRDYLTESALAVADSGDEKVLRAYLAEQDRETLVSQVLQVLPKDPLLYERLLRQAMLAADSVDAKELKRSITRVTPLQDIFEWGEVRAYFRRLEATLNGILEIADQLPAEILFKTALHGITRLNKALERIDDSGGYREHTQAILRELHGRALKRIEWTPGQRAEHLLEMALADPWDQFEATPLDYAEALGEAGLGAFYTAVETRLAALPALPKNASFDERFPYLRLTNYLMMGAREKGDLDEMIRLEKLTATSAIDFQNIARLYLKKGDPEKATQWLSKADAQDKHGRRSRNVLWSSVHAAMGNWEAAIEAQEAAFQRDASYDDYKELMELAIQAGRTADVRESVFAFLRSRDQALSWSDERRAWTLVRILKNEQDWAALGETALRRISDSDHLLQAARWIARKSLEDAGPVYEKAVDALVARKTNRSYRAAVRALIEARPVLDATDALAFDKCVSQLRETHFRKRNFMAVLDKEIGAA
jgi:uncharacterized Zn finger protein